MAIVRKMRFVVAVCRCEPCESNIGYKSLIGAFDRGLHFDDADTAYSSALTQIARWGFFSCKRKQCLTYSRHYGVCKLTPYVFFILPNYKKESGFCS